MVGIPGNVGLLMPLYAPLRLTDPDRPLASAALLTLHAIGYAFVLVAVATMLWYRRIRLRPLP